MDRLTINNVISNTIEVDDRRLVVKQIIGDGLLEVVCAATGQMYRYEDPETGELVMPDIAWVEAMHRDERLKIIQDAAGPVAQRTTAPPQFDHDEIIAKDPKAEMRVTTMRSLLVAGAQRCDPDLSGAIDGVWTPEMQDKFGDRPTTASVRAWFDRLHGDACSLASMMSMSGRVPRASQLDPEAEAAVDDAARWFYALRGRNQGDAYANLSSRIAGRNRERKSIGLPPLKRPSKETLRRRINAINCREVYAEKWGEKLAKSRWDVSGKGLSAVKVLAIGLMDDTVLDNVAVFDADTKLPAGRPWICILLDVRSRCVVGWYVSFVPPSTFTAAEVIRRANRGMPVTPERAARYPVLTQMGGRYDSIITDNGKNYVGSPLGDILADLGTTLTVAPVGTPKYKGMVERFFFTLKTWLLDKLPGATLEPRLMRECGYDPEKEAALTLAQLEQLITDFIYVYHISVHSGIDAQPVKVWRESLAKFGRSVIADPERLRVLTRVVVHDRRLTLNGVRFLRLTYRDTASVTEILRGNAGLEPGRTRTKKAVATVKIKYDPGDLATIHVWNNNSKLWVELPCTTPEYAAGLSVWQHEQLRRYSEGQKLAFNTEAERLEARDFLNRRILELAPTMAAKERRAIARMSGVSTTDVLGDVVFAEAEHRHDGLGPIIVDDLAADVRTDGNRRHSGAVKGDGKGGRGADSDTRMDDGKLSTKHTREILASYDDEDMTFEEYQ